MIRAASEPKSEAKKFFMAVQASGFPGLSQRTPAGKPNRSAVPASSGVTLIGSGDDHYVTVALLARLKRPFTLILVDHHTDGSESVFPAMLSCGSWIRHAFFDLPQLARVIMIGPPGGSAQHLHASIRERIMIVPDLSATTPAMLLADILTNDVYFRIDKDVFDPSVVRTNWDQGNLTLEVLLPFLDELRAAARSSAGPTSAGNCPPRLSNCLTGRPCCDREERTGQ